MQKCPFCFEDWKELPKNEKCPYCQLHTAGKVMNLDYPSVDRKKCYYCGKSLAKEAIFCRYCQKWLDDVERMMNLYDNLE